jgi:hypothetical protein
MWSHDSIRVTFPDRVDPVKCVFRFSRPGPAQSDAKCCVSLTFSAIKARFVHLVPSITIVFIGQLLARSANFSG